MKHSLFLLLSLIALAFTGCAVDAVPTTGDPATPVVTPAESDAPKTMVRRYTLHKDGPATYQDYEVPFSYKAPVPSDAPGAMHTMSATIDPCQYINSYFGPWPDKMSTDLILWHDEQYYGFQGYMVCITGTGTLDLTTAYYASIWPCFSAPNPTTCINNLRISGNVRAIHNQNTAASACYLTIDANTAYFFSTYPSTTWGPNMDFRASYLANSTSVTCF